MSDEDSVPESVPFDIVGKTTSYYHLMSTPIFTTTLPSSAPSSLCPGYKHVEEFGVDDEYDDEDEIYVTLDLGAAEPMLIPSSTTYRLIVSSTRFLGLTRSSFLRSCFL